MSIFAASENHVDLHLVPILEESASPLDLELNVVLTRLRSQPNLLDLDGVLLASLGLSLLQFVLKFPVIHDPTDRWTVVRTHFYKIQAGFHCQLQPFLGGKDTDHISIRIDHADRSDPDLVIDQVHLFRRCRR